MIKTSAKFILLIFNVTKLYSCFIVKAHSIMSKVVFKFLKNVKDWWNSEQIHIPNWDQMEKNHTHVINRPDRGRLMVNRPLAGRYRVIMIAYLMLIPYLTCMQSNDNAY